MQSGNFESTTTKETSFNDEDSYGNALSIKNIKHQINVTLFYS